METELKNIKHDLLHIKVSKYEQSVDIETPKPILKNKYFKPRERSQHEEISVKSFVSASQEINLINTLFDVFAFQLDKSYILNKDEFKTEFKKNISDESLKTICKHHKVLKKDLHSFVDAEEYMIPSNTNVILFFGHLMKTNIYIVRQSEFFKYNSIDTEVEKVVVINEINTVFYSTIKEAEQELITNNCIDSCLFYSKTKFKFIKDYVIANKIMIPLIDCKNRASILNCLKKLNVNKN